jgi:ubiquinone/menaquinone biosynthesis C-methylase UbiE
MIKKVLFGTEIEKMPDSAFRLMKIFFVIYYFLKPAKKYIKKFGIKPGNTVVDYGCGPGAFIKDASSIVGEKGTVYAVDVHEMAIASVEKLKKKHHLANVKTILTDGNRSEIPDGIADLIYALDMFHMIKEPDQFLKELCRISRQEGILIIEDGHQPRSSAKEKILHSGCWKIIEEEKRFLKCFPVKQNI